LGGNGLFIGGTSSNSGKSWMATAVCAWLRQRGVRVAPFKAQNMSNHSFPCVDGGEIGRAQMVQAEACGLPPESAMNPILLKPASGGRSQVVVRGRVWRTLTAREYYAESAWVHDQVMEAYQDLAGRFDVVVIEGAGSVSEMNLRQVDLVNLGLVTRVGAPWILVADIERGGVFASVVGTIALLSPEERSLLRGFAINKFRGDRSLFDDGRAWLEVRTGVPCLGVFPHSDDIRLDAEDSLSVETAPRRPPLPGARIAIVRLPHLSNPNDFVHLTWADWIDRPDVDDVDFVILPGTKDTIADLEWMRGRGLDRWVLAQHQRGAVVLGICGGYQMLGDAIEDPRHVESGGTARGLSLLPVHTELATEKVTRTVSARTPRGAAFEAYEIHMGMTRVTADVEPFAYLADGRRDGARVNRVMGTYLHGALESSDVVRELFGVAPSPLPSRAATFGALAAWLDSGMTDSDWLLRILPASGGEAS
jgi:adenosylcobyric acid synthase